MNKFNLDFLCQLIECDSVTPDSSICQDILISNLKKIGFSVERFNFNGVPNFIAKLGNFRDDSRVIAYAGHTDVVPAGDKYLWMLDPFSPKVLDNKIYGRGVVDMKGSIACMFSACYRLLQDENIDDIDGGIIWLITGDEEGDAINGTIKLVDVIQNTKLKLDYCIVGEPTSENQTIDTIKIGRRGSINGTIRVIGKQGHIAYPDKCINPIHIFADVLSDLLKNKWKAGDKAFQETAFQISSVQTSTSIVNVIPEELKVVFNFRYPFGVEIEDLDIELRAILDSHLANYKLEWRNQYAKPFLSCKDSDLFKNICKKAIEKTCSITPVFSTSGGTSDARFISQICDNVVEIGLKSETAHQINEHAAIEDLQGLQNVYYEILQQVLIKKRNCSLF